MEHFDSADMRVMFNALKDKAEQVRVDLWDAEDRFNETLSQYNTMPDEVYDLDPARYDAEMEMASKRYHGLKETFNTLQNAIGAARRHLEEWELLDDDGIIIKF